MVIGNRGLVGQPAQPYVDFRSYAGVDAFLDLTFLDYTNVLQTPSAIHYQVDDLTNSVSMVPSTAVTPTGPNMLLQIPGSVLVMTHDYQGSQLCQIYISATLPAVGGGPAPVVKTVAILELVTIQTPSGAGI